MNNETQTSRYNIGQKIASVCLSAAILTTTFVGLGTVTATQADAASTNSYGLVDNIQDGTILHCFCWKYNDIKAMLPEIAEAGFTSIQTSPPQATSGTGSWWWVYQPLGFYIGTNALGTKDDLKSLCTEAEKYGIKIIADVVANHLAGDHSNIQSDLKDSQYWHPDIGNADDGDRYRVTHGKIGMPDLNTEHSYVQQCVAKYIQELKSVGVDGIRFDAAKHIGLPSEGDQFWKTVTADKDLWYYGEILNNPGISNDNPQATTIMKEYTDYMTVTDSTYGMTLRDSFGTGTAPSAFGNWCAKGLANNKIIYWGESHDNWSNNSDWGYSWKYDQNIIDRAYAVAASRNEITALYFSRPSTHDKDSITLGAKGSTHFTSKEVAAVNHFHNAMVGQKDYYTTGSNCSVVCREKGAVIVAGSGGNKDVTVPNGGGLTAPGTYKDEITGSTWTVTATTISGHIGDSGIAVVYNPDDNPPVTGGVSATPSTGTSFTDTLSVTLSAKDVTNAKYTTSEGASGSYTDGKVITVGASTAEGSSVTVTLSGTKSDGSPATATYTYKKTAPKQYPTLNGGGFVFDNSSKNWSTVNAYVYDESGSSTIENAAWPGVKMTDCGNGYWKYELDSTFANSSSVKVIFNNGSEQIPGAQQPGFDMKVSDKKLYEGDTWKDLPAVSSLKATLSASPSSVVAGNPVTLTASSTGGSGTVSYEFKQGSTTIQASSTKTSCTWTPSTKGSYTITVTAKDSSGKTATATTTVNVTAPVTTDPVVNVNKPTGTTFTTETLDVTLTLSNAVSGTYSVDNGPEKTFTGSKTVTLGQGKIGDSTVTLKTTAKNAAGTTKTYTFTYEKDYVVKTSSSSATLASQYKTNPNGKGKNKTISVDGDISDWDSSMLIAQGAANDDPRVYRPNSMYELPIDLYALYGAYDDNNLYLMWEMTNVQDVVAPRDNYPLSQGILWQTQELPFFIAIDTGDSSTAIGNDGQLITGGTIWDSGMTISNSFNKLISINTKGGNGPYVYSGDSSGLNPVEELDATTSKIKMNYGLGILSTSVNGINGAYGENNSRVVGDICNDSAAWVDFNTKGHNSKKMDFFYELSIPYSELGITKSDVESNGVGVLLVATFGKSAMDCLPYDVAMNDNADQPDTKSQANNSFEKSDEDHITTTFARIGNGGVTPPPTPTTPLQVNFGTDRSAPQLTTTALTLKAVGYGGTAPYKYQFYVDNTSVKSNSTTNSCSWTPTEGTHTIKCVITDSTGATATVSKTFTAEKAGSVTDLTNNSTISSTSIKKGSSVTLKGSATGGTAPYQYTYCYKKAASSSWTVAKGWSNTTSVSITPAAATTYDVCIKVKDANGTIEKKYFTVKVTADTLVNNSTISKTSINKGDSVTLKAAATGGTSPYTYAYYYKRTTSSSWTTAKTWSSSTSVSIKPAYASTYDVCIKVKDAKGTIAKKYFTVKVTAALTNNSTVSATSISKGDSVTLTGKATGGTSPYTYAYYYKRTTSSSWTTAKTWSSSTSVSIKPAYASTYDVCIKVKDSKGTIAKKYFTITVKAPLSASLTASSTSVSSGTSVKLTAKVTGGQSSYTYEFSYLKIGTSTWKTIKAYSSTASATFTPSSAGTYSVRLNVKDAAGTVATKYVAVTVS